MGIEIDSKKFLNFLTKAWCHCHIRVRKRTTAEDNISEDGNLQLHEEIIDTIIGGRQSRQNSGSGISKLAVGIKKFWTEVSKNNSLFKGYKDQLAVP